MIDHFFGKTKLISAPPHPPVEKRFRATAALCKHNFLSDFHSIIRICGYAHTVALYKFCTAKLYVYNESGIFESKAVGLENC